MKTNLYRRRDLCRLILARDSMNAALDAIQQIVSLGIEQGHPQFTTLQTALIASYGRTFLDIEPLGKISANWSKFKDKNRQWSHDQLYEHRMTQIAHVDFSIRKVMICPPRSKRTDGMWQAPGSIGFEVGSSWFAEPAFLPMLDHISKLTNEMHGKIMDELTSLYWNDHTPTERFEIIAKNDLETLARGKKKK
jgi:hypothetical protein